MALAYTPDQLKPQNTNTFTTRQYWRDPEDLTQGFDVASLVEPGAVAALGETYMIATQSHADWAFAQPEGRIDGRRAWRQDAVDDRDIFRDRTLPSPSTVRVIVLQDASGSMQYGRTSIPMHGAEPRVVSLSEASTVCAATLVQGLAYIPNVEIEVLQHSFGHTSAEGDEVARHSRRSPGVHTVHIRRAWDEGTPLQFMNVMPNWGPGGGNADGHAIVAITDWLENELQTDETPMIIVISDGAPADLGKNPDYLAIRKDHPEGLDGAEAALVDGIAYARQHGIKVLSVAIAGPVQSKFYGKDAVVAFDGNWITLAQALAAKIGETVANEAGNVADDPFAY